MQSLVRRLRQSGIVTLVAAPRAGANETCEYTHDDTPVFRYSIPTQPTRAEARGEQTARGAEAFHRWLELQRPDIVHFHTFVTGLDLAEVQAARGTGARVFVTTHSSALGYVCLRGTLMRFGEELCDGVIRPRTCAACALHARGVGRIVASAAAAVPPSTARQLDRFDTPLGTALGLPAYIERRQRRQRELFESIDRFFVLTNRAREMLLANGAPAGRVALNRLGVDADIARGVARSRTAPASITVGFLGRFDPLKGLDDLFDAIEMLPSSVPVRFDIRGVQDQAASATLMARALQLAAKDSRVTLGGPVSRACIASVITSWDVMVCPGKSLEGGPTVALEALALGTPVIATNVGGIAELLSDGVNGALVPPGNAQLLAETIERVSANPSILDAWRAGLPPVRTMDDVAEDYLREYAA